jgi:hypothetical protein
MRKAFLAVVFLAVQGFAAFNLTWGVPAVSLDSNPPVGDSDVNPTIAIDVMGNAVATWGRTCGNRATEDIWVSSYNHGSRVWTGAVKISGGGSASNSTVDMDAHGNAVIVWEEGFPTQILSRVLNATGVWSPPLSSPPTVVQASTKPQIFPQINMDGAGNAIVIWMESYLGRNRVYAASKPQGLGWKSSGPLSSNKSNAEIVLPSPLAINDHRNGFVVWQETSDGSTEIHGARYANGAWMEEMLISAGSQPAVAVDPIGNGVIVWTHANVVQSKTFRNESLSKEPVTISHPLLTAQHPCVAMDDMGNAVVVFERYDGLSLHKFVAGASLPFNETKWSTPVDISVPSPANADGAGYPRLCLNAIGDGVVVWKEFDGEHMVIQGAGYSVGTWSFIRTLSSKDNNSCAPSPGYDLGVSLNRSGNIIAVWPEDPSGGNAQHIKAAPGVGLAMSGPLPPMINVETAHIGIGTGYQVLHRFPAHSDLINILDWTSPGGVAYFRVYRNNLSSLIGSSQSAHYEDHQRVPGQKVIYLITSVDMHEHESGPMAIIVHPK